MMQKYKKKLILKKDIFSFRVKRQRKNVIRRKKVSLFRLKTLGFGFFWTCSLFKAQKLLFLKKKSSFFFYKMEQEKPDVFYKNVSKTNTDVVFDTSSSFFSFFSFFSFWDSALSLQHLFFFNKILTKTFFFLKLFFFKTFFLKLFFLKLFLQHNFFLK